MENNSVINFKIETIDDGIGFEKGIIVGQMKENPGIILATTLNHDFLTIFNIKDPKDNFELKTNARLRIERKRQLDVVMQNGFSITEEQIKKLHIENNDQLSMLCIFTGNCYDVAPTVIEQMRKDDYHAFLSYQEEFVKIKTLQKDFPGVPMIWSAPK